ncbi:UNVERIFIED_CONTAM: hypothetical protein NCL1_10623 [Trichonephila clavipes]
MAGSKNYNIVHPCEEWTSKKLMRHKEIDSPDAPVMSLAFSFLALMKPIVSSLVRGTYIKLTNRSPSCGRDKQNKLLDSGGRLLDYEPKIG